MEFILSRKIKVVGCLNCPYLLKQQISDNKHLYSCTHPSFIDSPIVPTNIVENIGKESEHEGMIKFDTFPGWCPLDTDSYECSCYNSINSTGIKE